MAESHTEDMKYLCRFNPCNEILRRLYEIFETSKKQDLTPPCAMKVKPDIFTLLRSGSIYFAKIRKYLHGIDNERTKFDIHLLLMYMS